MWRVQHQALKYFAKKVFCGFAGISHVFFGGISQVTHRYLFKDLPRFSEHLFSRTALKCCSQCYLQMWGKLWMIFELSVFIYGNSVKWKLPFFWLKKVIFVFPDLFLLFPSLIIY